MLVRFLLLTLFFTTAISSSARAHDMWLQPSPFAVTEPDAVKVRMRVGHEDDVKTAEVAPARLLRFDAVGPDGGTPTPIERGDAPSDPGAAKLTTPGVWTLVYHARPAYIELEAEAFEKYLRHEGLDRIVEARGERGEREAEGRESYGRSCKALVQVGTSTRGFDRRVGLPIEIVAVSNPFAGTEPIRFRVDFRGEPLRDARVDLMPVDDLGTSRHARTNREGIVSFPAPGSGRWLVATTHMVRAVEPVKGDWQSFWATLAFGRP